jgi:hypothetical protein
MNIKKKKSGSTYNIKKKKKRKYGKINTRERKQENHQNSTWHVMGKAAGGGEKKRNTGRK